MKTRKMWVLESAWYDEDRFIDFSAREEPPTDMRVLVTDATGMPDLAPGDRVRAFHEEVLVVESMPYKDLELGHWLVATADGAVYGCDFLTKLPREKTVTLRVTGPEHQINALASRLESWATADHSESVRVERVEDPDER